jgi:hypothetical protein
VTGRFDELRAHLERALDGEGSGELDEFLVANSSLPGPTENLELAQNLAGEMVRHVDDKGVRLWGLVTAWADLDAGQARAARPREFLPFCAALCIGALGAASEMWWLSAVDRLRDLSSDPRARVRKGVVLGVRRLLLADFLATAEELVAWVESGRLFTMQVVAEAISDPRLLTDETNAVAALALHRALIDTYVLLPLTYRGHPDCRPLRKTLAYSLSIAVAAQPQEGFKTVQRWAARADPDLNWILIQNLTEPRLADVYQSQTEMLLKLLKTHQ